MTYRHSVNKKLTAIVGILMLCAALVGTAGASGRHHRSYHRSSVRITNVRQSNRIAQANSNTVNVVAVGGSATATCSPTNTGTNTATATGAGGTAIAANLSLCNATAAGGLGLAVNTGAVNQTGTNMATATNTSSR